MESLFSTKFDFMSYRTYKIILIKDEIINLRFLFYTIFFSIVALSFSGGLNAISFRTAAFITLGAILGHLKFVIRKSKLSNVAPT